MALAAAAVIELAYTFFTDGPDEAIDPLILGLSSAMLIQVAGRNIDFDDVLILLLEAVLLTILFLIRLFLVEPSDEKPRLWWLGRDG